MDASENQLFTQIAEQYYETCQAEEQSGKTAWIGIKPDYSVKPVRWKVSKLLFGWYILFFILGEVINGTVKSTNSRVKLFAFIICCFSNRI